MRDYDFLLVFGLNVRSLDSNFRKYWECAGFDGFIFHDIRYIVAIMLSCKLDVMDLCCMFGWTNTTMVLRYYNSSVFSIVGILNR